MCLPTVSSCLCPTVQKQRLWPPNAFTLHATVRNVNGPIPLSRGGGVRRLHLCLSSGYQSSLPLRPFLLVLVFSLWILLRFSGFVFAFKRVDGIILAVSGNTALVFGIFSIFSLGCTLHVLAI